MDATNQNPKERGSETYILIETNKVSQLQVESRKELILPKSKLWGTDSHSSSFYLLAI